MTAAQFSYEDVHRGAAVYTPLVLAIYDLLVIRFENPFVWMCPSERIINFYNQHISARHLDVGVGTGYFIDKAQIPSPAPMIALLDLNPNSLNFTARRLRRYRPETYQANVLEPIPYHLPRFDSIGMNFLLHCLPGDLKTKGVVFKNLSPFLSPHGVLFGSTILGEGVRFNPLTKIFMRIYNSSLFPQFRVLHNQHDRLEDLIDALQTYFEYYWTELVGTVAFFVARYPKIGSRSSE